MRIIIFLSIFLNILLAQNLQKVSIQLDWKYQFEFAGYITAKEKGFYKDVGLDVKLVQYHNNDIVKDVLNGKYDFGIYDNNLIIDKINGEPIKLVASFFKRSALVLIVDKNIKTLKQLEGKTLMIAKKDVPTFKDFLLHNRVNISKINFVPTNYSIEPFIQHKVNGFSAFITDEVYLLEQKHIKFNIINPSDYNFMMYQGELFTSDKFANNNPVLVTNLKKATIKGWRYALNHKNEISRLIYNKYTKRKSIKALNDEANKIEKIVQKYIYPIGFIDRELLKSQFRYQENRMYKKIDLEKTLNEYIFSFKNPLNLTKKYLWLIKLYNCYSYYKLLLISSFIFIFILIIIGCFFRRLNKEKKKIETLFNKVPVAYILIDTEKGILQSFNDYAFKLFDYPKDIKLNFDINQDYIDNDSFYRLIKLTKDFMIKNKTMEGFNINLMIEKYNKKTIWINVKGLEYSDTDILWIITDIDDIMRIQEKLDKQIKETNKVMKVKEEFLANMSHEIRTPLNAILGFVDIIIRKETNKENKKYLDIISKSGKSLLTIINDILDFSKIESGKLKIEKIEFNPQDEFETIISLFGNKANEKKINFQMSFTNLDYRIISDPIRIKQIIANFVSNAIKFTPEGGNIYCNINYNKENEKLYIEIVDKGIGIPSDKLASIFEPFSQADSSITRKYGGTGLGLSISKKLIELLDGDLKVDSKINEGSSFYFSIIAKKTTKITEKEKEERIPKDIKFIGKVLIVEDNKANQMFLRVILNTMGLKDIEIANDGLEAIEKVEERKYDIILMDENMPNMNGLEASKKIKEMGVETPIIAVTANALIGDKDRFLKVMNDYTPKPVEKDSLLKILKKYLKIKND